jgi:hypothetical protein
VKLREIDAEIRALKIWRRSKASVLGDLMRTYRDAIELIFLKLDFLKLHSEALETTSADVTALLIHENRIRAGTLWALKWACEFCPADGTQASSSDKELVDLLSLGPPTKLLSMPSSMPTMIWQPLNSTSSRGLYFATRASKRRLMTSVLSIINGPLFRKHTMFR